MSAAQIVFCGLIFRAYAMSDGFIKVRAGCAPFEFLPKDMIGMRLHGLDDGVYVGSENYAPMRLVPGGYVHISKKLLKRKLRELNRSLNIYWKS